MRIHSLLQRGFTLCALALAAMLGSTSCNEADGTDPWPGVYPPEAEIDRPKGTGPGGTDAGSENDAEIDADTDTDAEPSTSDAAEGATDDAAPGDGAPAEPGDASEAG